MGDLEDAFGSGASQELSETQQEILDVAKRNPDMKQAEIADVVGCSESYVSTTLREYMPAHSSVQDDGDESSSGGVLKWILLGAVVLGGLALLSEAEGSGSSALVIAAAFRPRLL